METSKQNIKKNIKRVRKSSFKAIKQGSEDQVNLNRVYQPANSLIDEFYLLELEAVSLQDIRDIIFIG